MARRDESLRLVLGVRIEIDLTVRILRCEPLLDHVPALVVFIRRHGPRGVRRSDLAVAAVVHEGRRIAEPVSDLHNVARAVVPATNHLRAGVNGQYRPLESVIAEPCDVSIVVGLGDQIAHRVVFIARDISQWAGGVGDLRPHHEVARRLVDVSYRGAVCVLHL